MARIKYDLYLQDVDELIVISNANQERSVDIFPESFENPALSFVSFETESVKYDFAHFEVSGTDEVRRELDGRVEDLLRGRIPEWRLIGLNLSPTGLSMYCVAARPNGKNDCDGVKYDEAFLVFCPDEAPKLELVTNYDDGLPPRRHIVEMKYLDELANILYVVVTEYFGKRKVRRIEFTEGEGAKEGQLCHITEY